MIRESIGVTLAVVALVVVDGGAGAAPLSRSQRDALLARVPAARVQADTDGNRLFDDLEARLATMGAAELVRVVVRYRPGREPAQVAGAARGFVRLPSDHSVATRLTRDEIRRLSASDAVESIEADTLYHFTDTTSAPTFGITKAHADFGLDGDGDGDPATYSAKDHTIAVLDTGIDGNHQDFAGGKIIAWKDFIHSRTQPYDDVGHGTHCASIAAGEVNAQTGGGVAPAAALVGLKIGTANGAYLSDIVQSVEWCITNKATYGIEVITLSLGSDTSSAGTDALSRAVNRAAAADIVVCVAAGNSGPNLYTIGSPAAATDVIAVGNMADPGKGGFYLDRYSSRGPSADGRVKPDVCAPGEQILAARANSRNGYIRHSGTSMATPFVAGVASLMREANPDLSAADVKAMLKETAVHFGPTGENNDFGAGRVDGYQALAKAAGKDGSGPAVPGHSYGSGHLDASGAKQSWQLTITDTQFPIAVTLIMESKDVDFDLEVYDPNGRRVARSATDAREEGASFRAASTGTYTFAVVSYAGEGDYALDISAGSVVPLKAAE